MIQDRLIDGAGHDQPVWQAEPAHGPQHLHQRWRGAHDLGQPLDPFVRSTVIHPSTIARHPRGLNRALSNWVRRSAVLFFGSGNWDIAGHRITAGRKAVRDVAGFWSAGTGSGLHSAAVAAPRHGGIPGSAASELPDREFRDREGSRAALPRRSCGLARSAEPDLLLPGPAALRRDKGWGVRLPQRGQGGEDAGRSRLAVIAALASLRQTY